MLGLLLLVVLFLVLGFMLAWVVGIVAREEISVGRGVGILVCALVANIVAGLGIAAVAPGLVEYVSLPVSFAVLTLMIKTVGGIEWKPAVIVAAIYSVIIFLVGLFLATAFSPATPS